MTTKPLDTLAVLAALRQGRSAARLAKRQAVVTELERRKAALRTVPDLEVTDIAVLMAQDRHDAWRTDQLVKLNRDLASAHAEAQPFRDEHARDIARQQIVAKLAKRK